MPAISVILPVYNGMGYLELSVFSVLKQDQSDFEFLIVDDCSTDSSWEFLQSLNDNRIKLYRNISNKGLFPNLNFLISESSTPLIKLWAQDDIMYPSCLSQFVKFHEKYPDIAFSYSARDIINSKGEITKKFIKDDTPEIISTELHASIAFYCGSIAGNIANLCISKKSLESVGLFKEHMKISADFDMLVRLAENSPAGFIRTPLIQLRDHEGQLSRNENYYANLVTEDIEVYRNLLRYVPDRLRKEGMQKLRRFKFIFYYTLMLKLLFKGKFKQAGIFYSSLTSFDNLPRLTYEFIKQKIFK